MSKPSPVVKTNIYWCKNCQTTSFEDTNCALCGDDTRVTIGWIEQKEKKSAKKV